MKSDGGCIRCRGGRICGICECSPDPWFSTVSTPAGFPSIPGLPTENPSTPSEATETAESSGTRATLSDDINHFIFGHPCADEDHDEHQVGTRWRQLLLGPPPGLTAPEESIGHDEKTHFRRRQNVAWRQWWAMHQNPADYNPNMPTFAPTPTSTCPPSPGASFKPPFQDVDSSVVYMPVPVELVPEVHQFVEHWKRMRFLNM